MGAPAAPGDVLGQLPDHHGADEHGPGSVRMPGPRRLRPGPRRSEPAAAASAHTAATASATIGIAVTMSAATVKGVVAAAPSA